MRDTLSPTPRLPPEILREIFLLTSHSNFQHDKGKITLSLSWVSHEWRELAHGTSSLWTCIDLIHPEWIETALSRSNDRLVQFYLELKCYSWEKRQHSTRALRLCFQNLSRVDVLSVGYPGSTESTSILEEIQGWSLPAPRLVELRLHDVPIRSDLFSGTYPSLRLVHLIACKANWDEFPIFLGLEKLLIGYPRSPITIGSLIKLLRGIGQSLEELFIAHALRFPTSIHHQASGRLQLDNLKKLSISEPHLDSIKGFLDQISLPRVVKTTIHSPDWSESVFIQGFLPSRNISRWDIDCLSIAEDCDGLTLQMTETTSQDGNSHLYGIESHPTQLGDSSSEPSLLLPSAGALRVQPVNTFFCINYSKNLDYLVYLGKFRTIRKLSFNPSALPILITFIKKQEYEQRAAIGAEDNLGPETVAFAQSVTLFRDLQVLELRLSWWTGNSLDREDSETLQKWLMWRKRLGHQLQKLVVTRITMIDSRGRKDWPDGLFEGMVGEFELVDVDETK
ncbi:hypothetical protein BDN72DRAFT_960955 [Pluteus cervinus]|uniref:Uncharacterized protein n=1 Tax=Pluteus cervinus TaxID=181527 RepID=A0ACD3ANK4_9AGAR|nr:hypothetical protein BDN72DRAFT_960955 [Pluteus cervinus]